MPMFIVPRVVATLTLSLSLTYAVAALADHHEAKRIDAAGTWRWEHNEEGRQIKNVLVLDIDDDNKVTGTYTGEEDSQEIIDAELDGDELTFYLQFKEGGVEVDIMFLGNVAGDKIDGSVEIFIDEYDIEEEFPWKAERWLEPVDVVGKWHFEIVLPGGEVLKHQIAFSLPEGKSELEAKHFGFESEMKVSDIEIREKELLMFTVSGDFGGGHVIADYIVTPRGNKLQGDVEYELHGDFGELEVTATRQQEKQKEAAVEESAAANE